MIKTIDRFVYREIRESLVEYPAIVILGARQVGKTTLALDLRGQMPDSIHLDLESPRDLSKIADAQNFFETHNDKLIIIDEVQRRPEIFQILRTVIDANIRLGKSAGQFLLLGSASGELLKQSSESLAGRIDYINLQGLNVFEIGKAEKDISKLWLHGSYPKSYLAKNKNSAMRWNENLIVSYLEKDIPQLTNLRMPSIELRRLFTMLAHLHGETINYSKIAASMALNEKTVRNYISIFADMFLLRAVHPFYANVKKRLVKSPRYYIRDSGILHCLLGIQDYDSLISNPILGKSWEGFVVENIHSVLPKGCEAFFYRTAAADAAEIDLVIKMPNADIWAVEIKYGSAPNISRHYSRTCKDVGAKKKYVIYSGNDEFKIKDDVIVTSLTKFMQLIAQPPLVAG